MKKAGGVPGPEHSADMPDASMFAGVADVNVATLDAGECLEYAGRCAQLAAFVQARQTEFLAAFGSYRTDPDKAFDADGAFTEASGVPGTDDDKPAASSPETTNAGAADADTSRARAANAGVANAGVADPIAAANAVGPADCAGITARDIFAESLVRWAGDEVGCELDIAGRTGASRLIESELAVMCLPRTLAAFKAGRISARRYRKILDQAGHLPAALARQLDDTVDGWDDGISFDAFSRRLKRWIMAHQPDRTEEDHARVITDRRVEFMPDAAGAAWLMAYGPADRLALLYRRLDKAAHATDGADTRTSPQKRFDLLAGTRPSADEDTGADESTSDDNSVADGSRWRIGVTIPVTTLLGGTLPGHMNGYGPIPAAMARRLAAGAGWIERILTDPITSRPIDAERGHYRLTTGAQQYIRARNTTCTLPACSKPAEQCELDHLKPWPEGDSDPDNLQPVCKSHHQAKTTRRFHSIPLPPDTPGGPRIIRWTLPTGHQYDTYEDTDPDATAEELAYLDFVATQADKTIAKQDHARRHHAKRRNELRRRNKLRAKSRGAGYLREEST